MQKAWQKSFTKGPYRIGLHVLFWIVYLFFFKIAGIVESSFLHIELHLFDFYSLVTFALGDPVIYLFYYLTIFTAYKYIVYQKKYIKGIIALLICIVLFINGVYFSNHWAVLLLRNNGYPIHDQENFAMLIYAQKDYLSFMRNLMLVVQTMFAYFLYMSIPMFCKFIRDQLRLQMRQSRLEKEKLQLEMDFMKAQIHPHFLFNTLNNIYSLITHHESDKSAEMVAGLSSLLRYALYDGKTEFILLGKEIGMLKDFIELEAVRSDDTRLVLNLPSEEPSYKIPPFLLLPLVENAFKHGVNSQLHESCVSIDLQISDGELILQVQNSFNPEFRKENSGGLGLANLKKRLDYYYENRYKLHISEDENIFTASLKIPLSCPKFNA